MWKVPLALFILGLVSSAASAQEPVRSITSLGHGIYRFQNDTHYSIFVVGKRGLVMTDPINREAALWLRAELKKRFGALPIDYVIYSHNHPDHVSGGEVFRDAHTRFVAHAKAARDLERQQLTSALPDVTFTDRMTLVFEGRELELAYWGPNNGAGSLSVYIPDAKFLFAVDWVLVKRLPWKEMYHYDLDGMIDSLHGVLELEFTTVAPGHSVVGTKKDLAEFLAYLEALRAAVLEGMNAGKSLEQLQREIKLPRFSKFAKYEEWLPLNIKGAYEQLARTSGRYGQEK